jgi:hypothetical protein
MCRCHRGPFQQGYDCRRHQFTASERRRGEVTRALQIRWQLAAAQSGDQWTDPEDLAAVVELLGAHWRSWHKRR